MQSKSRTLLVALLILTIVSSGCFKSKNVVRRAERTSAGRLRLDGVTYALPRTILQARVPFKKTDKAPGEFEMYAPCFFSPEVAAGRVREKSTTFSIGQASFSSRGEPDPNEHYIAIIKGGYFENKTMFLEFNSDGVITKGEATSENVAVDVAIKALKTGISIAATAASPIAAAVTTKAQGADLVAEQLAMKVRICRATLVAEAASEAAAAAMEAAKASGNPFEPHAITARDKAKAIQQNLAAKEKELTDLVNSVSPKWKSTSNDLVNEVICEAKAVRDEVQAAANAASAVPDATEAVQAARNSAKRIDETIAFVGVSPKPYPPAVCPEQDENTLAANAFANGYYKAKEIFARIKTLKQRREELTSGENSSSAFQAPTVETLKKMLEETDATIKAYENTFFLGTVDEDSWTANFDYRPGRTKANHVFNTVQTSRVLIWFSKTKGLCESRETTDQGIQIKPGFKAADCSPDRQAVWIGLQRLPDEHPFLYQMANANRRDERLGERGFYYRVPARAIAKITLSQITPPNAAILDANSLQGQNWNPATDPPTGVLLIPDGKELARDTMKIAQMGVIASLPSSAAGRTTQYSIDFDESTGALKNFKLTSNALLEKTLVEEAGAAASDIVAAKQAREKAKKEATDELTQKKRELDLLKTQNEINEEKKKLEAAQPAPTPTPSPSPQ